MAHLQLLRNTNSNIFDNQTDAINNLKTYINSNEVVDGEPILSRYKVGDEVYSILGIVTIYNNKKSISIFSPNSVLYDTF